MLRKKARESNDSRAFRSTAATYSPNWWVSTIGDGELNFSVRNGKRWFLTAIATAIYFLRETSPLGLRSASRGGRLARPLAFLNGLSFFLGKVFRDISTGRLNTSPCVHLLPIYVVVSNDPHGSLISETASRLDAFSAYPDRTWIPGGAAGATTGKPEVRPSRSSRTKDRPPQTSNAHNR